MIPLLCLVILSFFFVISAFNLVFAPRLHRASLRAATSLPGVSILIPARNEEHHIERLLKSLLASRFVPLEILVLDDQSTDRTLEIARTVLQNSSIPHKILSGRPWAPGCGLTGKNHACAQLSEAASGEVLLFCDADVAVSPHALERTLSWLLESQCSGVSAFPRQIACGPAEKRVLPWVTQLPAFWTLPLRLLPRIPFASMQFANGQWLCVWRKAYLDAGGHAGLGSEVLEDVVLARKLVKSGKRGILPVLAPRDLEVRMYDSWSGLVEGFSKNLIRIFGGSKRFFVPIIFSLNPTLTFSLWAWPFRGALAAVSAALVLCIHLFALLLMERSWRELPGRIAGLWDLNVLAIHALVTDLAGTAVWKGRVTGRQGEPHGKI
jgi:glycosyltransferase involved in cell wall biosynthesis